MKCTDQRKVLKWNHLSENTCRSAYFLFKNDDVSTTSQNYDQHCNKIKIINDLTKEFFRSCLYDLI